MTATTLHYVHDPLCGWCYAVSPMVATVAEAGVRIVLHGGGLFATPTSPVPDKSGYIREHDGRIAALTAVAFGPAYLRGLLSDATTVFWSRPTVAAVLAAGAMESGGDLRMLGAIQRAHYVDGRRVVETPVLSQAAETIGLSKRAFLDALHDAPVDDHIASTRRWMRQLSLRAFPSFVLERDGDCVRVDHEPFYGKPGAFLQAVNALAAAPATGTGDATR